MKEVRETFSMRIPPSLRKELQKRADEEGRSLASYIIRILEKAVKD